MAEYTFADVIIDPDDPRAEVGKQYYYADVPACIVSFANDSDRVHFGILSRIEQARGYPFRFDRGPYACIIRKKELSYAERQKRWIEENGIKAGDRLRVTRKAEDYEDGWSDFWDDCMDTVVGKVVKTFCPSGDNGGILCQIEGNECLWSFPYFVLEKVKEPEKKYIPFDLSNKEDRAKLRGAWIRNVESGLEYQVICIGSALVFVQDGDFNAGSLLEQFVFLDGTPCGKLVEE